MSSICIGASPLCVVGVPVGAPDVTGTYGNPSVELFVIVLPNNTEPKEVSPNVLVGVLLLPVKKFAVIGTEPVETTPSTTT